MEDGADILLPCECYSVLAMADWSAKLIRSGLVLDLLGCGVGGGEIQVAESKAQQRPSERGQWATDLHAYAYSVNVVEIAPSHTSQSLGPLPVQVDVVCYLDATASLADCLSAIA